MLDSWFETGVGCFFDENSDENEHFVAASVRHRCGLVIGRPLHWDVQQRFKWHWQWGAVAQWLECATDNRVVAGSIQLRPFGNFANFLYPTWPVNVDEKKWLYTYGAFTSICVLICIFHLIKRTVYPVLGIPGIFFPSGGVLHPATFICRHRNVSKSPIYTWFVNICEITDYEKPRIAQCTCMRTGQTVLTEGRRWRNLVYQYCSNCLCCSFRCTLFIILTMCLLAQRNSCPKMNGMKRGSDTHAHKLLP